MADTSVAQPAPPTEREEHWRALQERTTRGMLLFNAGGVLHLEGAAWAVQSSRGGFHRVDLGAESCTCEDWTFYGREHDVPCKHRFACAIAHATRRRRRRGLSRVAALIVRDIADRCDGSGCDRPSEGFGHDGELCESCARSLGVL